MPPSAPNRRAILQGIGALAVIPALPADAAPGRGKKHMPVTEPDPGALPIVDTHQHLWDLSRFRLPWLAGAGKLNRSFSTADYDVATKGLNVVKTVYMEVDVTPEQHEAEADYVIELCRRDDNPMSGAVIGGRPGQFGFRNYINLYKTNRLIKGVRQVLHGGTPRRACLEPEFVRDIQYLGEIGKSFDLCLRSGELADAVLLVDQCPGTRFILDHCGNQNPYEDRTQWARDLGRLADRQNVVCKISGIAASARVDWKPDDLEPVVRHCLREFGRDRVMFGGDWPVCTLGATFRQWVEALRWIVRNDPPAQQAKLFAGNAIRVYDL